MSEEIKDVKLSFSCNENWDAMTEANGGRHCDKCQKKVYDFTNSKADEFRRILAENNNSVCGRFNYNQATVNDVTIFPLRRTWVAAVMILLGFNLTSCEKKNRTKQKTVLSTQVAVDTNENSLVVGEVLVDGQHTQNFDILPEFPGGNDAYAVFLRKNIKYIKGTPNGRVVVQFTVKDNGNLSNIHILKSLTTTADQEVIRVFNLSPKWHPATNKGKPVDFEYTVPVIFSDN